jgi:hypothetical protein
MTDKCKCGAKLAAKERAAENDGCVCKKCGSTYAFISGDWHYQVGHNPFENMPFLAGAILPLEGQVAYSSLVALHKAMHPDIQEQPSSWVADKVNLHAALHELEHRPHQSMFPFMDCGSRYCACDSCKSERRRLIKELRDLNCENK